MKPTKEGYIQTYPEFVVAFAPGEFSSSVKTLKAFEPDEYMVPIERFTKGQKAYTSLQCGPMSHDHIELNTDLVYVNHSCDPNIAFDLSSPDPSKWHIRALKRLEKNTTLTFFYPSTEWDMDQAFTCECNSLCCIGRIQGAKYLSDAQLTARKWTNPWIWKLITERDEST